MNKNNFNKSTYNNKTLNKKMKRVFNKINNKNSKI